MQHALVKWVLSQHEFSSKALKAMAYQRLEAPTREALQILEHAELVYITVDNEGSDTWTATSSGRWALARGKVVVQQQITERTGAVQPVKPIAERLQQLDALHDSGVISEAENAVRSSTRSEPSPIQ